MNKKHSVIILSLSSVVLLSLGAACSNTQADGGVFKSSDRANTWEQKTFAGQTGRKQLSISGFNTTLVSQDPTNPATLFLGTEENGLWYSGNAGDQWGQVAQISSGKIRGVVFDTTTPTTIYVLQDNKILKTLDAGTTWETVYTETSGKVIINLALNPQSTSLMYAGLENGKVIRSTDGGLNWSVILSEAHQPITRVVVNPQQPSTIFALEFEKNLWRSQDSGVTWVKLYDYDHILQVRSTGALQRLVIDSAQPSTLYVIADNVGVIRTDDSGDHWTQVNTLVGRDASSITAFQVDPSDSQTLWMGVGHFIHVSYDHGVTWSVLESFPSARQIVFFTFDHQDPNTVYAGTRAEPKKGGLLGPG